MRKNRCYSGYFKEHYLRSFGEFLYALKLFTEFKKFKTEGVVLKSPISGKRKIPDFVIYDENDNIIEIVEIKNREELTVEMVIDYSWQHYHADYPNVKFTFVTLANKPRKILENELSAIFGEELFKQICEAFKSQTPDILGFAGEKNPMFGRKHSAETLKKISERCARPGELNGMYGKTHTSEAKVKITEKWKDVEYKHQMMKNGLITHVKNLNPDKFDEFYKYYEERLSGLNPKRPKGINFAYLVSKERLIEWFGSIDDFWNFLENMRGNTS